MADIFVSYASEDRERAKAIAQALEQQGWSVWWDRVIPPGKQWADVIESEINAARCVVVLWSKVSVKGDWVKKEARAGLRRRILVPALIEPADLPFEFEDIQAADLTGWSGDPAHPELRKLCDSLAEHAGPPPAAVRATEEAEARARAEAEARERREREAQAREEARERTRQEAEARQQAEREARAKAEAEATARAEEQARVRFEAEGCAKADTGLTPRKEVRAPAEPQMLSQEKPRTSSAGRWLLAGVAAVVLLGVFSLWDGAQEKRRTEQTEAERQATEEKAARARRAEAEAWALAEHTGTREALRDYLARVERREIPGVHEGDAQRRLQELQRAEEGKKAAAEARVQAEREARLEADTRAQEEWKKAEAKARADAAAKAKPAALSPGQVFSDCADCPEMVVIPAGEFVMGSPDNEPGREKDEGPQRRVTIAKPFALGRFEVTVGQFSRFVEATGYSTEAEGDAANGCVTWSDTEKKAVWRAGKSWRGPGFSQGDDHPVVCVSWNDATKYVQWLSTKTGKPYRLPSEAEWEYAARAGTKTARYWGDDPNQACRYANVADRRAKAKHPDWVVHDCDDGYAETAPAGRFEPNRFKLYDMLGNAWEWAEDCWNGSYEGAPSDGSAWESGDCGRRVLRGGSLFLRPEYARVADRLRDRPGFRLGSSGFRVARTL